MLLRSQDEKQGLYDQQGGPVNVIGPLVFFAKLFDDLPLFCERKGYYSAFMQP